MSRYTGMRWGLLRVGCDCQDAAEQCGPLQGPHSFRVQGPQCGVIARVERHGFFPQRVLMCQPGGAVPDLNVREARLAQADAEVCPAYPGAEPLIIAVQRFPAGQRRPATGLEDPSDLFTSSLLPGLSRSASASSGIAPAWTMPARVPGGKPICRFMIPATTCVAAWFAYQPSKYSADSGFGGTG